MSHRSKFRQRIRLAFKAFGVVLLVAVLAGAVYEQVGQRRDRERLQQVGRSVDIGGRTLNIYCSGEGAPAVIFDAGHGDPGFVWSHIQPEIAKLTRACWYDRAGEGWSEPGPFPRTTEAMAKDLHGLLHAAGIPAPYVLVGHSLGGMNARVYNSLYPADVAGAVLVDAAHEDEFRRAPEFMLGRTAPRSWWRPIWVAAQTARAVGLIRLMSPPVSLPAEPAHRTREQILRALRAQPKALATHADASAPESDAEAQRAAGFGDRPLIVLTRGNAQMPPNPSAMDREWFAYEQVWMHEIQPKLARLSTRGRQIIIEHSGHRIQDEAPDDVIAAISEILAQVRIEPVHSPVGAARVTR
jgi:pimeloyl-ACP methyl ester carboxylesterase